MSCHCKFIQLNKRKKDYCAYEPVPLLFVNRFLSFLYESIDDAVEPFGSDDVEFSADDDFDSDDDELSDPEELDFEINDLVPDDDADEYVLFELKSTKSLMEKNNCHDFFY